MKSRRIEQENLLRHYVSLSGLLDILYEKRMVLGDPSEWEDKNDQHVMNLYKDVSKLKTLRAICFAIGRETNHHWGRYGKGVDGACIEFKRQALLKSVPKTPTFRTSKVNYEYATTIKNEFRRFSNQDLPFLKRKAFQAENEFRIIFASESESVDERVVEISFELDAIHRILISPHMRPTSYGSVKKVIKDLSGSNGITVTQSKVFNNKDWQDAVDLIR